MEIAQAQRIYDTEGSQALMAALGITSRSSYYDHIKALGLKLRKRGNWRKGCPKINPERAARIVCQRQQRQCVIHDLPGACEECKANEETVAGVRAGWSLHDYSVGI